MLLVFLAYLSATELVPANSILIFVSFFPAAVIAFYLCGTRAGLITTLMCALSSYVIFSSHRSEFPSGNVGLLACVIFILITCLIGMAFSRLRAISDELEANKENYRLMLEAQSELISQIDVQGVITYANESFCRFLGKEIDELVGSYWHSIIYQSDLEIVNQRLANLSIQHPVQSHENRVYAKDGTIRWVNFIHSALYDVRGHVLKIQSVGRDITEQKEQQDKITYLAFHDALTDLPNRLLLSDRISQALTQANRSGLFTAVCYLDLDGFKAINDEYGHETGDQLLIQAASRMIEAVRAQDTVSRLGGDEFVILLSNLEEEIDFLPILDRVIESLSDPFILGKDITATISASVGVAVAPIEAIDGDALIRKADNAMYWAKKKGPSRVTRYQDLDQK